MTFTTKKKELKKKTFPNRTWSLTIGNGGENHTGMEFLGKKRNHGEGWDLQRLLKCKDILENIFGKTVELYNLNEECLENVKIPEKSIKPEPAYLMICRNFLTNDVHKNFIKELESFGVDVLVHDPMADAEEVLEHRKITLTSLEEMTDLDGIVLAVPHQAYLQREFQDLGRRYRGDGVLVDIRSIFEGKLPSHVSYWCL